MTLSSHSDLQAMTGSIWCRQYVSQEAELIAPATLLDQFGSSGWALIAALIKGERTAADLLSSNSFVSLIEC